MSKQVCKYSIIRFQPYAETEEFANIGIVLYATASKRLEFRLQDSKHHARITNFFDPVCKDIFVQTSKIIRTEIERIRKYLDQIGSVNVDLYAELIRSRQDIIRFSESRVLFCDDPKLTVETLFEQYVNRSFLKEPSYEEKMKKQVKELLILNNLGENYKEGAIGEPNKYEVHFPFISKATYQKVIKPIHFRHDKPTPLIEHGNTWLSKIQQLQKYRFIKPDQILFAYTGPDNDQINLFDAFREIKEQAEKLGVVMADINEVDDIAKFAAN